LAHAQEGKKCHIIYLGDHDPSGIDMTRDVRNRIGLFMPLADVRQISTNSFDVSGLEGVNVIRIALNMEQIEELNPPENPAKESDSRCREYVQRFGTSSWELDAIEPKRLAQLVREAVWELRDLDEWKKAVKKEELMREELNNFAKHSKFKEEGK